MNAWVKKSISCSLIKRRDDRKLGYLRESPFQPPSSGANDFSKGTESLAKKVLQGKRDKKEKELIAQQGQRQSEFKTEP